MLKNSSFFLLKMIRHMILWIFILEIDFNFWPHSWGSPLCIHMVWIAFECQSEIYPSSCIFFTIYQITILILSLIYDVFFHHFLGQTLLEFSYLSLLGSFFKNTHSFTFFWIQSGIFLLTMKLFYVCLHYEKNFNICSVLTLFLFFPWVMTFFNYLNNKLIK
jgi:hypothetical protein